MGSRQRGRNSIAKCISQFFPPNFFRPRRAQQFPATLLIWMHNFSRKHVHRKCSIIIYFLFLAVISRLINSTSNHLNNYYRYLSSIHFKRKLTLQCCLHFSRTKAWRKIVKKKKYFGKDGVAEIPMHSAYAEISFLCRIIPDVVVFKIHEVVGRARFIRAIYPRAVYQKDAIRDQRSISIQRYPINLSANCYVTLQCPLRG